MNSKMCEGDGNTALPQMKSCLCIETLAVQKKMGQQGLKPYTRDFLRSQAISGWTTWAFPKIRVPQNGWFIMEYNGKPYFLMDDLGGTPPYFWKHTQGSQGEPLTCLRCAGLFEESSMEQKLKGLDWEVICVRRRLEMIIYLIHENGSGYCHNVIVIVNNLINLCHV